MPSSREDQRAKETLSHVTETTAADTVALPDDEASTPSSTSGLGSLKRSAELSIRDEGEAAALHGEEVARARGWSTLMTLLGGAALCFTPFLPLEPAMKVLLALTLAGPFFAVGLWVRYRTRAEEHYTNKVFRIWGYSSVFGCLPLMYCLGVFSPTPLVVTLGLSFFALGLDRKHALLMPWAAIVGYLTLALLITLDVIEDRGMYSSDEAPQLAKAFFVIMAPAVLAVTVWMSRVSRAAIDRAVERATKAIRLAGKREAQLVEAQQNLEQALRLGAGESGRYTGRRAGAYELAELVGRGAAGEVYAADDTETGARVAVKVLRPEALANPSIVRRFQREGQVAGGLDVPNVVTVLDFGSLDDGTPYITMELLEGEDLGAHLRKKRRLGRREINSLVRQIGAGLDAAHAAEIVHRDLKPQNLFLTSDQVWKILDFGVSRMADSTGTLTQAAVVGTPGYMAPEQARAAKVDKRADLFALGAVIYRALTGQPPFSGANVPQILFSVVYDMPTKPSSLVEKLPADIDLMLAVALAKDPSERFQTVSELADALEAALESRLDEETRSRAEALLQRHAWGSSLARESSPG